MEETAQEEAEEIIDPNCWYTTGEGEEVPWDATEMAEPDQMVLILHPPTTDPDSASDAAPPAPETAAAGAAAARGVWGADGICIMVSRKPTVWGGSVL